MFYKTIWQRYKSGFETKGIIMVKTLSIVSACLGLIAFAATPMVSNETAKKRYPWGLVDITCTVSGIDGATAGYKFALEAVMPESGNTNKVSHFWVVQNGTNSTDSSVHANGNYHLLWDARADLGQECSSNMILLVKVVDLHDKVQLWKGGPYWSATNIGADEPYEYGYYFWWGDTVGYKRVNSAWVASDGSSLGSSNTPPISKDVATLEREGWITSDGVLAPEHDAAHVQWGGDWRMPTQQELDTLNSVCEWTWTTMNGVNGYIVRGKGDYAWASIFFPAAGYRDYTSLLVDSGSYGWYWSSVPFSSEYSMSCCLYFCNLHHTTSWDNGYFYRSYRNKCKSVRPVQGFTGDSSPMVGGSAPMVINLREEQVVTDDIAISWDTAWIGGNSNATVVIADNGTEVRRVTGTGEFTYTPPTIGRHELTYTTYIDGVAQENVYRTVFYMKWKYMVMGSELVITDTTLTAGEVIIPSEIDGHTVSRISNKLFKNCTDLTEITIPDSVTSIGSEAFYGCKSLKGVRIPHGVVNVGSSVFYGCNGLANENGFVVVQDVLWYYCGMGDHVIVPDGVTSIGEHAFDGCSDLTSVEIPNSVTNIGLGAFAGCSGLENMILPFVGARRGKGGPLGWVFGMSPYSGSIGISQHHSNSMSIVYYIPLSLKKVTVTDESQLEYAFDGCSGLTNVTIPNSVTSIGSWAFSGCSGLTSVTIPDRVTKIGNGAFNGCSGLTDLVILGSVTNIGVSAFYDCNRLASITIANSVTGVDANAFTLCTNLTSVVVSGDIGVKWLFYKGRASITNIVMASTSTNVADLAFSDCNKLKSVTIPEYVTSIGASSFAGCSSLTSVTIPSKVTIIGNGAFSRCSGLTSVIIPASVTIIGNSAFAGCRELSSVYVSTGDIDRIKALMTNSGFDVSAVRFIEMAQVVFAANGGSVDESNRHVIPDCMIGRLPTPVRTGYVFLGWFSAANGGMLVTTSDIVRTSVIFYAHWRTWTESMQKFVDEIDEIGCVSLDDGGSIVVTLTNDVSGTVEIPDNVGAVTIDLNGHNMVGDGGGLGETALPGGPAIRVVKGDGDGGATRLAIVDTSEGEKGQIFGGGESSGIEVAEDAATGVKLDVEDGVGVFNGDGSEQELKPKLVGAGKVTTPKTWKTGQKVTWKATADKGSVFAHWEGPLVDSLNLAKNERRNPSLAFAVPEGFETNMVTAVFIPIDDDGLYTLGITQTEFELKEAVSDVWVTDDSQSYVTASASGLPTGLKFDAKKMCITGTPTKGGVYWVQIKAKNASGYQWAENVKVTVSGDGKEAKEPKLTRTAYHPLTVICATEGGTVSGTGVYAEGKKVTIKATAAKGYVFAGWYATAAEANGGDRGATALPDDGHAGRVTLPLAASMSVTVPEMRYVFAKFVTVEEDRNSIDLAVNGEKMRLAGDGSPHRTNIWAGVYMEWPVAASALSETKVKVAGLPAGLKFTEKPVTSKIGSGKTAVTVTNVPAYTIYGAPTAASKADAKTGAVKPSVMKVTVTTAGKSKVVYEIDVTVDALPEWAVGTFGGVRFATDETSVVPVNGQGARSPSGVVSITVAANGKISGKLIDADGTWTLSAAWFDEARLAGDGSPHQDPETGSPMSDVESPAFVATVIGKNGKKAITNVVEVAADEAACAARPPYQRGVVSGWAASEPPVEWTAWQNLWKTEPWKTDAKDFAKAQALTIDAGTRDACPYPGTITLKFAASGAVTASGKFVTGQDAKGQDVVYSASCSAVLVPEADAAGTRDACPYLVFLNFPPKAGKFDGYALELQLVWDADGKKFSVVEQ